MELTAWSLRHGLPQLDVGLLCKSCVDKKYQQPQAFIPKLWRACLYTNKLLVAHVLFLVKSTNIYIFNIGAFFPVDRALTPENIRDGWEVVNDFKDATIPTGIQEALGPLMQNLQNKGENARLPGAKAAAASAAPTTSASAKSGGVGVPGYKASVVFEKVCTQRTFSSCHLLYEFYRLLSSILAIR